MDITLLHTAQSHVARFDALRDRIAPSAKLTHIVRPDWLSHARQSGLDQWLRAELHQAATAGTDGPVLCTCTTIGPLAGEVGAMRIDAPVMRAAASIGGRICLAYSLTSTIVPSRAMLVDALAVGHEPAQIDLLDLTHAWPAFERGDQRAFASEIAEGVCRHLTQTSDTRVVVLAQASMDVAMPLLRDADAPVLAAPEMAFRAMLAA